MAVKVQIGIDTISYYHPLTPKQKNKMVKSLKELPKFEVTKNFFWEETYEYVSNYFASQGIRLKIFRNKGSVWGMYVIIHPMLILGNPDRSALYQASKGSYGKIVKTADRLLKSVDIPCSIDGMGLYRIDVTRNYIFDDCAPVNEYIRILKKSRILPHYKLDWFREDERKAKDCKEANRHSYKQKCKTAAFFAYDKTAQLGMIDRFPSTLIGKTVLRIEGQFRPKSLKKWVSLDNNWQIIRDTDRKANKILKWYMDRVQPKGDIVRYKDAVDRINSANLKSKTQKRMLYLLRKTSDRDSLSAALEDLRKEQHLSKSQCSTILKNFRKLEVSPITLRNDSEFEELPPLQAYMNREIVPK